MRRKITCTREQRMVSQHSNGCVPCHNFGDASQMRPSVGQWWDCCKAWDLGRSRLHPHTVLGVGWGNPPLCSYNVISSAREKNPTSSLLKQFFSCIHLIWLGGGGRNGESFDWSIPAKLVLTSSITNLAEIFNYYSFKRCCTSLQPCGCAGQFRVFVCLFVLK